MSLTTYAALDARLRTPTGKPVVSRKIANHTYAQRTVAGPGVQVIHVRVHQTNVVSHYSNGLIRLDAGGWLTTTTRERMNRFTPAHIQVFSTRGRWHVTCAGKHEHGTLRADFGRSVAFKDGVTLEPYYGQDGHHARDYLTQAEIDREDAHNARIERLLTNWLRGYTPQLHKIQAGSAGLVLPDATGARVHTQPHMGCGMCVRTHVGVLVGDSMGSVQHLLEHLEDGVYPWTLFLAASGQLNNEGRVHAYALAKADVRSYIRQRLRIGHVATQHGKRPQFAPRWRIA